MLTPKTINNNNKLALCRWGAQFYKTESFPEKLFRIPGIRKAGIVFQDRIISRG